MQCAQSLAGVVACPAREMHGEAAGGNKETRGQGEGVASARAGVVAVTRGRIKLRTSEAKV